MSDEPGFVDGLIIKEPHERAPDFVKAKGSIKIPELIEYLQKLPSSQEWLNFDVKVSRGGNWYCAVDTWKPDAQKQEYNKGAAQAKAAMAPEIAEDDIPF